MTFLTVDQDECDDDHKQPCTGRLRVRGGEGGLEFAVIIF